MGKKNTLFSTKKKVTKGNHFDYSEIYRQLRTNVEYASIEKEVKVISITSSTPSEAKSTVATNLASVYASKYPKTLILDCDLRKPTFIKL